MEGRSSGSAKRYLVLLGCARYPTIAGIFPCFLCDISDIQACAFYMSACAFDRMRFGVNGMERNREINQYLSQSQMSKDPSSPFINHPLPAPTSPFPKASFSIFLNTSSILVSSDADSASCASKYASATCLHVAYCWLFTPHTFLAFRRFVRIYRFG